jgi:hypothetical protein
VLTPTPSPRIVTTTHLLLDLAPQKLQPGRERLAQRKRLAAQACRRDVRDVRDVPPPLPPPPPRPRPRPQRGSIQAGQRGWPGRPGWSGWHSCQSPSCHTQSVRMHCLAGLHATERPQPSGAARRTHGPPDREGERTAAQAVQARRAGQRPVSSAFPLRTSQRVELHGPRRAPWRLRVLAVVCRFRAPRCPGGRIAHLFPSSPAHRWPGPGQKGALPRPRPDATATFVTATSRRALHFGAAAVPHCRGDAVRGGLVPFLVDRSCLGCELASFPSEPTAPATCQGSRRSAQHSTARRQVLCARPPEVRANWRTRPRLTRHAGAPHDQVGARWHKGWRGRAIPKEGHPQGGPCVPEWLSLSLTAPTTRRARSDSQQARSGEIRRRVAAPRPQVARPMCLCLHRRTQGPPPPRSRHEPRLPGTNASWVVARRNPPPRPKAANTSPVPAQARRCQRSRSCREL